jgi:hypothetical protein
MGRPLNKKYFGNRNVGSSSTTADDGLGGNRVASVTITTPGSYTTRPTVTFSAPDLAGPGAVTATGTTNMEALSATVVDGKTGYVVGDLLTITGAGGAIAYVASVDGVTGAVLTVNFTGTGAARGDQTVLTGITTAVVTTTNSIAGVAGVTLDVAYRVKSITITNTGSGYTDATDAAVTFSAGTAAGTAVLESYTVGGVIGNNENAITISAYIPAANGGLSAKTGDIIKQVSTDRYRVKTADGTGICKLAAAAPSAGQMTMTATDSAGGTYYVTKLTSRKALLIKGDRTGTQFTSGTMVAWNFDSAVLNTSVKISNA